MLLDRRKAEDKKPVRIVESRLMIAREMSHTSLPQGYHLLPLLVPGLQFWKCK